MSTMQEFYDNLSSDDQRKDSDWQKLKQLVTASLDQLRLIPNELEWYFWTSPVEANT